MVGAGQLARMTCQAAIGLGVGFRVLAGSAADSAAQVCADVQVGDYTSRDDVLAFAAGCDVVTFDHEHVPGPHLAALEKVVAVRPGADALRYTQDKLAMRERLAGLGVSCPRYAPVSSLAEVTAFAAESGWPVVLKAISGGYDGRGVWVCETPDEAAEVLAHPVAVFAEQHIEFDRELAVLAARSPHGQAAVYPVVQTVQRDGICHEVLAPAPGLEPRRAREAQRLVLALAAELDVTGLLAVELFDTGRLLVNELAMRPHNSGHWTIEGAVTSQFEQHLRAVLDGRTAGRYGECFRWARSRRVLPLPACDGGRPGREDPPVREAGAAGAQDRARDRGRGPGAGGPAARAGRAGGALPGDGGGLRP